MKCAVYFAAFVACCWANDVTLLNSCSFTVWPGIQGQPGRKQPNDGGYLLEAGTMNTITLDGDWAGRIWARTKCDGSGHCETGDCGNRIECNGASGVPPASLVEFAFGGDYGVDSYGVSHVNGYNVPLAVTPFDYYVLRGLGKYDCGVARSSADLDACPSELSVKSGQSTVACMSACMKRITDRFCRSDSWPVDYPAYYKQACTNDTSSTYTCLGKPATHYRVTFCP